MRQRLQVRHGRCSLPLLVHPWAQGPAVSVPVASHDRVQAERKDSCVVVINTLVSAGEGGEALYLSWRGPTANRYASYWTRANIIILNPHQKNLCKMLNCGSHFQDMNRTYKSKVYLLEQVKLSSSLHLINDKAIHVLLLLPDLGVYRTSNYIGQKSVGPTSEEDSYPSQRIATNCVWSH